MWPFVFKRWVNESELSLILYAKRKKLSYVLRNDCFKFHTYSLILLIASWFQQNFLRYWFPPALPIRFSLRLVFNYELLLYISTLFGSQRCLRLLTAWDSAYSRFPLFLLYPPHDPDLFRSSMHAAAPNDFRGSFFVSFQFTVTGRNSCRRSDDLRLTAS